jgi:hypothetical protein
MTDRKHLRTTVGQRVELNSIGADGAQTSVFDFSRNRDQPCPVDDEFAEYALNRNRHFFLTPEEWNDALWREHFITNRIRRLIHGGFWPPPIGWCTDLLSDGTYELPRQDFIESLKPRRPQLAVVNGQRV